MKLTKVLLLLLLPVVSSGVLAQSQIKYQISIANGTDQPLSLSLNNPSVNGCANYQWNPPADIKQSGAAIFSATADPTNKTCDATLQFSYSSGSSPTCTITGKASVALCSVPEVSGCFPGFKASVLSAGEPCRYIVTINKS